MFKQVFNRLILCLVLFVGAQHLYAQGFQRIYDTTQRDLVHNCSSSTADGGFYVVSRFSVRNLPAGEDSIGIHVTKCDIKGELMWGREYYLEDANYELYSKGIECKVLSGDTLAIVATDIEESETSDAKLYFTVEPGQGEITFQTRLLDIDANTEDINPGLQAEILVDHNREVYYFGSHNSGDTIGIHMEKFGPMNESLISRTFIGLDADTLPETLSLLDAHTMRDTGFVLTARLGDDEEARGAMIQLDSLGDPVFATSYSVEDGMSRLDLIGVTSTPDTAFMQLGILSSLAAGTETSVLIKTDSIGRVLWSRAINIPNSRSQGQEIALTFNNEILVVGKYADFGVEQGDYAIFFDLEGNILRQTRYTDTNSIWDDSDNAGFQFDAVDLTNSQDGQLLITSQAQMPALNLAVTIIKADQEGMTLCQDTLTMATLTDFEVTRDTLMLIESVFMERDSVEFTETGFSGYDIPMTSLVDVVVCPNVALDTFFDATLSDVDTTLVSYLWSTGDTTAMIRVVRPAPVEDEQLTVVITVLDQVCYTICDTTNVMVFPEPQGVIESNYLCDTREWQLTVQNTSGEISAVQWIDDTGTPFSANLTIIVPDTPGVTYAARFFDACGREVIVSWTAPPLPVATIGVDNSNLCPVPGFLTLIAGMDPLIRGPLTFSWTANGGAISDMESIQIAEADLNGGPVQYEVTVTDDCGNVATTSIVVSPEDFELILSTLEINDVGLTNEDGCPLVLGAAFLDGISGSTIPVNGFLWSPGGETTATISVTEPGTYSVTATDFCDRELSADFVVTAADLVTPSPSVQVSDLGLDPCDYFIEATGIPGEQDGVTFPIVTAMWTGPNGFTSTDMRLLITVAGTYTYEVTDACGNTASAFVTIPAEALAVPQPIVEIDQGELNNGTCAIDLTAVGSNFSPEPSYTWNGNIAGQVLSVSEAGTYTVVLVDGCGQTATASIELLEADLENPNVPTVMIQSEDDPDVDCGMILTAITGDGDVVQSYEWSTGETTPTINVEMGGEFSVTVIANCDQSVTSEAVSVSVTDLEFPNIFFPESDNDAGINNTFGPESSCPDFTNYNLEVYNRWGKLVFESNNIDNRWSGTLNSRGASILEEDVYLWQCTYTDGSGDQSQKGSVTMVRR